MRKKAKKYSLTASYTVTKEGISIYKVLRDEDTFSAELIEKYSRDVRELLHAKLDRLIHEHKVPVKEVQRIKDLIAEIEKVAEIRC
ncbi:MAG: hypothetical protein WC761_06955 [Candidatus Paceibacterota bacterium]|jgi:hypothetical protein